MSRSIGARLSGLLATGEGVRLPDACGAIGEFDAARVEAIAAAMDSPPPLRHDEPGVRLHLDREPIRWSAGEGHVGLAWSESTAPASTKPRSRVEAARTAEASGLEIGPGGRLTIHASGLGLHPLYVQRDGAATYFCTRIAPLADASPASLAIDWEAWAAIFEIGCPLGRRTGFAEIDRLEPGCMDRASAAGRRAPSTAATAGAGQGSRRRREPTPPGDILDAVRSRVDAVPLPRERGVVPLSGGWDSRLITLLLRERERKVKAVTINTDAGHHAEESLAAPVARGLGAEHELARRPAMPTTGRDWSEAARLQEHMCPIHLPMQALATSLSLRSADPIFDGDLGRRPDQGLVGGWAHPRRRELGSSARMLWRRFRFDTGRAAPVLRVPRRGDPAIAPSTSSWPRPGASRATSRRRHC